MVQAANGPTPLTLRNCTRVRVIGLAIVGGFYGLDVFDSADIKINKCDIRAGDGDGIRVFDSARVKVAKCLISDRKLTGVYVAQLGASPPTAVQVVACTISRAGLYGVLAQQGSGHAVLRCRVFDTGRVGIELNSSDGLIERNLVVRVTTFAAQAVRGDNNVGRKNRAEAAGKEGFFVGGTNALIEKNQLRNCAFGIWCPGANNTIRKNLIDTTTSWGILMSVGEGNLVEQNTVIGAGITALGIYSNNGEYRSNKLKLGKSFGVDVHSDGNEIVSNTTVMSAGTAFVARATATGNTIALNKAKKNLGNGLDDLSAPGANTFLDNVFTGL